MNLTRKKIILYTISAIVVIAAVVTVLRYFPLNRIMRIGSTPEREYVSQERQLQPQAPNALYFDFEIDPEKGSNNGLYKGIAHSGKFSAKVFGKNSYSIAIDRTAGEIGMNNLDAVAMSAWLYIFPTSNEINGTFVFTVNNDLGVNIYWNGINVSGKDVPMGKWFKISGLFDLSALKLKPGFKIQIYFWNNSSSDILADDFYIVFGGQKPRRGDSTYTDMTRGTAFQPRFNFPPYPVKFLKKQEISNSNSVFLVKLAELTEGVISPSDKVYKGNFTGDPDGRDELMVTRQGGIVELYRFCTDKARFTRIKTIFPADLASSLTTGKILAGRYTGTGNAQLLIIVKDGFIFGAFNPLKETCSAGKDNQATFKTIWKVSTEKLKEMGFVQGGEILNADFDGDKISELFASGNNGSWTLLKLTAAPADPLKVVASGKENSVPEWKPGNPVIRLSAGRFISNSPQDMILTIFSPGKGGGFTYSLRRFDAGTRQFAPLFPERQHFSGKTIGRDSLRPDDEFFTGPFDDSGRNKILRYSREWRYDLKEIKFNDTTFQVVANIDFSGYEKDFNPKYYEVLRIIPGIFLDPGKESLMIIGRNCRTRDAVTKECKEYRDLPFLPNTLQFYSFQPLKK
jgi:hypothetical protein